jgi:hypothetical protein
MPLGYNGVHVIPDFDILSEVRTTRRATGLFEPYIALYIHPKHFFI